MKKILSILCTLALVLGVVLVPGMFSVSAALSLENLTISSNVVDNNDGSYLVTNPNNAYYYDGWFYTGVKMESGKTYNVSFKHNTDNGEAGRGAHVYAASGTSVGAKSVPITYQKVTGTVRLVGKTFNADDLIESGKEYIAIKIAALGSNPTVKDIVITEVPTDDYIHAVAGTNKWQQTVTEDGSNTVATDLFVSNYGDEVMVFDYELDPNKTYTIEYEWKGLNKAVNGSDSTGIKTSWTAVTSTTNTAIPSGNKVASPATSNDTAFTSYEVTATGAELGASATNKYLAFVARNFNGDDGAEAYGYLRKVKVTEDEGSGSGSGGASSGDNTSSDITSSDTSSSGGGSSNDQYKNDGFLHPTYHTDNIGETVDNSTVIYGASSLVGTGFLAFDYQLEANATYLIEMDLRGHRDSATNRILIGATNSSTGTEFKGNTVVWEKGYCLQWQSYWHTSQLFKANDVIDGTSNYLALSAIADSGCLMKNIKINKVTVDTNYLHPVNDGEHIHPMYMDGGVAYVDTYSYCDQAWMVFDKELKADTKYQISFDYKGGTGTVNGNIPWSVTAASEAAKTANFSAHYDDATLFSNKLVALGVIDSTSGFTRITTIIDANDVLADGFKYLALVTSSYAAHSAIKNLKIEEFTTDSLFPTAFGNELVIGVEEGEVTFSTAVEYGDRGWMKFDYELQPDTEYLLSYDFRGHSWYEGLASFPFFLGCVEDPHDTTTAPKNLVPEEKRITGITVSNSQTFFTRKQITFNSNDIINGNAKYICLAGAGYPNKWTFKNIRIMKKPVLDGSNLLFNGDFDSDEMGETFWTDKESIAVRDNTQNHTENGTHALHITGEQWQKVSQVAGVESNGNYELSFWYKGTFGETAMIALTRDSDSVERQHIFGYEILKDTTDWKQYKTVINSGDYSMLAVNFVTSTGSDFYIDDVTLVPTTAAAEYNANTLIKEPLENSPEAEFRYQHYDAAQGVNMFENYDFEDGNSNFWDNLIAESNGVISIAAGEGYNGDNSSVGGNALKFSAVGLSETAEVYVWFDVKPNTQYVFSMWSRTPLWSQENTADIRWGFANPFDGESYFTFRENVRGYRIICNDNQWHRTTLGIDTKDNTKIAFAIKGANSTMYFDNLQFFENTATNKVDARPEVVKDVFFEDRLPYITNSAPAAIYVADSKNLIKNGTFEDADISFWNGDATQGFKGSFDGKYVTLAGWDGTVGIADSATSYGKALSYVSNDHITGKPLVTTYLNVIQVEKNTEYTFVADYLVTEAANGNAESGFGLAAYNTWNPKNIGDRINFKTNYDPNLKWQKVSYTFNTNNYDEVAFYVVDGGGAAYIDNVSLFKTSDGSETPVEDTPVVAEGEIKSNEYSITEDTITGTNDQKLIENVEEGTTIKEILDTLENSDKIKVFDVTGKEVTDYDKPVATGMTFRLMDGISALDAAVVLIRGDVNYDGLVNGEDMSLMMKVIISMNTFENIEMLVTDIDGDGDITSSDVAYVSKHIGGDRLNPIIIE